MDIKKKSNYIKKNIIKKDKKVQFRMNDIEFAKFQDKLKIDNKSVSDICRILVKSYIS
jgi:hypothetical protein